MAAVWQTMVQQVGERCFQAGLDLLQPFEISQYNRAVDVLYRLPDYGRSSTLGLLIGNTRSLWAYFLAALRAQPERLQEAHPLDTFVKEEVLRALRPLSTRWEIRWAPDAPPRRVAMQRLAQVSGLASLSPSHLSVHATYGPWIGLRAAVVLDVDGPPGSAADPPHPCSDCESNCMPKFRDAVAATQTTPEGHVAVEERWRLWLGVRDACPVGRSHRYSESQARYHYSKDVSALRQLVEAPEDGRGERDGRTTVHNI